MMHELQHIVTFYKKAKTKGERCVLATVVALEGSSYRKPGVRMLIHENGTMIGAVSGGCVEKEVQRQSLSVFNDDIPKLITYDGRYRLGCEGILYILIEPFDVSNEFLSAFDEAINKRKALHLHSFFEAKDGADVRYGTLVTFPGDAVFPFNQKLSRVSPASLDVFVQTLKPSLKLLVIGAEHDAVQLCAMASSCGWEITIVAPETDPKTLENFPGAKAIVNTRPEIFDPAIIDNQTAVVLMTHSYSKDLQYLLKLTNKKHRYLGILGPLRRREKLFNELTEHQPDIDLDFFESVHGPAGVNIGAETPQEIAVSIIAEILSVFREQKVIPLKNKKGRIHT
ncbi:XdhC family protein [Galbibacter pacificus]|uniref:XdhC family protein n=1 Tax=Galbibacter pacificus TaxID=2996052 RepID=A0ABT6FWP3_9FLAO|nr:XdhC/CoxI family protein [Galbibacter pacificus]MDG3584034.1 XdhC family protein [Galbibacter pacificus]MDG3587529.1 XdhC family protein [Galbibacter pacificus]